MGEGDGGHLVAPLALVPSLLGSCGGPQDQGVGSREEGGRYQGGERRSLEVGNSGVC